MPTAQTRDGVLDKNYTLSAESPLWTLTGKILREPSTEGRSGEATGMDRRLSAIVRRKPVTCHPSDSIESVLRTMGAEALGSLIVTGDEREPLGIFTLHDLLSRVALPRKDLADPISSVMSPVRVTLPSNATAYSMRRSRMVRQGVRHIIVVDEGKVTGIVSEKDLFDLQRLSLRLLSNEIKSAPDVDALAALAKEIRRLAQSRLIEGVSSEQLTLLISSLNDLLTQRILELEFAAPGPARNRLLLDRARQRGAARADALHGSGQRPRL